MRCAYVDVADEAGVAVGTVQHYFGSRDALLGAAFLEANRVAVSNARAMAVAGGRDPWHRLTLIVEEFTRLDRWALWLEFWAAARRRDELRAVLEAAYGAWREPIVEAIEEGVAAGLVPAALHVGRDRRRVRRAHRRPRHPARAGPALALAAAHARPGAGRAGLGAARARVKIRTRRFP